MLAMPAAMLLSLAVQAMQRPLIVSRGSPITCQYLEPDWEQFVPNDGANPNEEETAEETEEGIGEASKAIKGCETSSCMLRMRS